MTTSATPGATPTLRAMLDGDRIHLFDGAMGTELYARGVFVNVCYDALVLDDPEAVAAIHRAYVAAGADIIETNTFGANPVKLSAFGLDERTEEINRAAARLALEAADGAARVVGAVGPLGVRLEPWGPTSVDEARAHLRRQMDALLEGGVDGLLLETFSDLHELEVALGAAREAVRERRGAEGAAPVFAQVTVGQDGRTSFGTPGLDVLVRMAELGADAVGVNCSVGPAVLLDLLEDASERVAVPLVAQPNAGLPRTVRDRKMYMASPDYMARYARRFADAGVRFIGGCCGTTPEHIAQVARVVRGLQPRHTHVQLEARRPGPGAGAPTLEPVPLAERSALGRALASGEFARTAELVPPRGWDASELLDAARRAAAAGATAVTLVDAPRGLHRMASLAASGLVLRDAGVEPVMHYTCRDRNMMGMLSDLLGAAAAGVRNLLLVSGDPPVQGPYADATSVFDIDSIGLTNVVAGLNRGVDPGGASVGGATPFVIGVALNPGAVDRERELARFRWKVEAGADFAVTQPVFGAEALAAFLAETAGHRIPVLAGLWPLTSLRNAEFLAHEVPGIVVPPRTLERMERAQARGAAAARAEGVALAAEVLEAVRQVEGVQGVHLNVPEGNLEGALALLERAAER
jgi:methionine synthase / methylenetetrahydrofolate reductase(NADPH)